MMILRGSYRCWKESRLLHSEYGEISALVHPVRPVLAAGAPGVGALPHRMARVAAVSITRRGRGRGAQIGLDHGHVATLFAS
jgi:hypothetical protein